MSFWQRPTKELKERDYSTLRMEKLTAFVPWRIEHFTAVRIEVIEVVLHQAVGDGQAAIFADSHQGQAFIDPGVGNAGLFCLPADVQDNLQKAVNPHRLLRQDNRRLV